MKVSVKEFLQYVPTETLHNIETPFSDNRIRNEDLKLKLLYNKNIFDNIVEYFCKVNL